MAKRSNLIVSLGLAVFVAGAAATFFITRDNGTKSSSSANNTTVLYADKPIPAGTPGISAVDQGYVKSRSVANSAKPTGALTDPSQLAGKTSVDSVPQGAVLTDGQFAVPQTKLGTVKIPNGKTALAISLAWPNGVAGAVAGGDRIDIFAVVKDGPGAPSAKLIMQSTEVLTVSPVGAGPAVQAAATAGTNPTFLLAVTPTEAERLVYLTSFQALYFSLVSKDQAAVGSTPGSSGADALKSLS